MDNTDNKDNIGNDSSILDVGGIDIPQNNQSDITDKTVKNSKPWQFQKGDDPRRNLEGRPEGSISPITRLKQIFKENPEKFEKFVQDYGEDPMNRKHIVEMIDGKPKQTLAGDKDNPLRIIAIEREEAEIYGITTSKSEDNIEGQE